MTDFNAAQRRFGAEEPDRDAGGPPLLSVRQTVGLLYLLGGVATIPIVLLFGQGARLPIVLACAITSIVVGSLITARGHQPLQHVELHIAIGLSTVLTSLAIYAWGPQGWPLIYVYLIAAPYVYASFSGRSAALHSAAVALGLGVALAGVRDDSDASSQLGHLAVIWVLAVVTFVAVGMLVRQVTRSLEYVRREQRENAERLNTVMNNAPLVLWQTDAQGIVTFSRGSGLDIQSPKAGENVGKSVFDLVEPGSAHEASLRRVLAGETSQTVSQYSGRVYSTTMSPLVDDQGEVSGMIGLSVDITEKRQSEDAYRAIVETTTEGIWVIDDRGRTTYVNDQMCRMLGYSHEEMFGRLLTDFAAVEDLPDTERLVEAARNQSMSAEVFERRLKLKDGSTIWTSMSAAPLKLPDGTFTGGLAIVTDITERKASEEDRARSAELVARRASQQEAVARLGQFALQASDPDEVMREVVRLVAAALEIDNCTVLKFIGDDRVRTMAGTGLNAARQTEWVAHADTPVGVTRSTGEPVTTDSLHEDGRFREMPIAKEAGLQSVITVLIGGRSEPYGVIAGYSAERMRFDAQDVRFLEAVANVIAGVEHRQAMASEAEHQSLHDPLTGLPNRSLLLNRLAHGLRQSRITGEKVAVILLDLDEFKLINDSHGHQMGDLVLKELVPRLREELMPTDTLARLGGDEFVIVRETMDDEREAVELAERIAKLWHEPLSVRGTGIRVSGCIGISTASPDAGPKAPGVLLRDADAAMYRAKERGRGEIEVFDEQTRTRVLNRLRTESDLHHALERSELVIAYQPIVEATSGDAVGLEALLRWRHPQRGLLPPSEFIPAAEDSGLIVTIGEWVLDTACSQVAAWNATRGDRLPLSISVNISGKQFAHSSFPGHVSQALKNSGIDPKLLGLEITESILMQEADSPGELLAGLKELGVHLVLDDFGTGYSSLSYLHSFPLDTLKVDRSFISNLGTPAGDPAIVTAIVTMAQALGLEVIAEGVEHPSQLAPLLDLGCTRIQGFHFSEPMLREVTADYLGITPSAKIAI